MHKKKCWSRVLWCRPMAVPTPCPTFMNQGHLQEPSSPPGGVHQQASNSGINFMLDIFPVLAAAVVITRCTLKLTNALPSFCESQSDRHRLHKTNLITLIIQRNFSIYLEESHMKFHFPEICSHGNDKVSDRCPEPGQERRPDH